jgi:membrane fusion protein (multidrug efflux system)
MMLLALIVACKPAVEEAAASADGGPVIRTAAVEAAVYRPKVELTGSLAPIAQARVGFNVGGRLASVDVERGQSVGEGDELGRLDAQMANAQLAQARAAVKAAQAQADAAEDGLARVEKVGDAISAQKKIEITAGHDAAAAQLEAAEAAAKVAATNAGWHTLRAPIAGTVTDAPDNPGAMVGPGSPMFVVEDLSALRMRTTAPEDAAWIVPGLKVQVFSGTPGVTAPVDATVERVIPSLDESTRRIPVELRIDAYPPTMKAHQFARAVVEAGADVPAFKVRREAVVARPDFSVFVVASATSAPKRIPVQIVGQEGDFTVVEGTLEAGQLVVLDPPHAYGE